MLGSVSKWFCKAPLWKTRHILPLKSSESTAFYLDLKTSTYLPTDRPTDRQTDRRTDGATDPPNDRPNWNLKVLGFVQSTCTFFFNGTSSCTTAVLRTNTKNKIWKKPCELLYSGISISRRSKRSSEDVRVRSMISSHLLLANKPISGT